MIFFKNKFDHVIILLKTFTISLRNIPTPLDYKISPLATPPPSSATPTLAHWASASLASFLPLSQAEMRPPLAHCPESGHLLMKAPCSAQVAFLQEASPDHPIKSRFVLAGSWRETDGTLKGGNGRTLNGGAVTEVHFGLGVVKYPKGKGEHIGGLSELRGAVPVGGAMPRNCGLQ